MTGIKGRRTRVSIRTREQRSQQTMNPPLGFVAIVLTLTLATLTALAQATPPDQTWLGGMYDDADYDDVILLATLASTTVNSPERAFAVFHMLGDLVQFLPTPGITDPDVCLSVPRGPPLA